MKYIEVTGWGNRRKHFIPLNKIVDFNFEEQYTTISLVNGRVINVIETESTIKEMLKYHQVNLVNEEDIHTFYEGLSEISKLEWNHHIYEDDDELPF